VYSDMDMRSKLGVWFLALFPFYIALLVLDRTVLRPHEPIYTFTDRETLEKELDHFIAVTTSTGGWGEKRTMQKTGLVVSAQMSAQTTNEQAVAKLTAALRSGAWRPYSTISPSSVATLCKGRYRADIELMNSGKIALSLSVKRYQRDEVCAPVETHQRNSG
jgi:hypothetical protein